MQRIALILLVIFAAVALFDLVECNKKKLQIGVKKKVENCSKRSRKGDVLHMHYTVSITSFTLERLIILKSFSKEPNCL